MLSIRNDIAILRLAGPLYGSSYVDIANLPYPGQMLPHGYQCYISGWGLMDCEKILTHTYIICPMHNIYVCLIKNNNFCTTSSLFTAMGSVPAILQEAILPVVAHSVCSQPNWWGSIALKTMVCAGGDGVVAGCQVQQIYVCICLMQGSFLDFSLNVERLVLL